VKLVRQAKDHWVFHLSKREKDLLLDVLKGYPCVPPAHHRLTKGARLQDQEANQRLLDEALAEQRAENRRLLDAWVGDGRQWKEIDKGWHLSLTPADVEWLLQVLNDVRVGSWVMLGSPDPWHGDLTEETAPHLLAMELAGAFQSVLLAVIRGREMSGEE
jgi:hypothetical protein